MKRRSVLSMMLLTAMVSSGGDILWQGGLPSIWNRTGTNWTGYTESDLLWDSENGVTNVALFPAKTSVVLTDAVTVQKIVATNGLHVMGGHPLTVHEVTTGNRSTLMLNAPLSGVATIDKRGEGSLVLLASPSVTFTNNHPVSVHKGTLQLRSMQQVPTSGLVCQLDASNRDSLRTDASNLVTNWVSLVGGHCFTQRVAFAPVYNSAGMGGRGTVKFAVKQLSTSSQIKTHTMFFVLTRENIASYTRLFGKMGPGAVGAGEGIQTMNTATAWRGNMGAPAWILQGSPALCTVYINGVKQAIANSVGNVPPLTPQLLMLERDPATVESAGILLGLGTYGGTGGGISADVAEVLVYDRVLTTAERRQVERYLADKWWGAEDVIPLSVNSTVASATNILSQADLNLVSLSLFDLYGNYQTLTSICGEGTVGNMATARTATLTLKSQTNLTFSAHMALNTRLVKEDSTTWRLATSGSSSQTEVRGGEIILEKAPIPMSGLVYHLDANKTSSITLDASSTVEEWRDVLGMRPFTQATAGSRPTYTAPTESSNGYLTFGASGLTKLTNGLPAVTKTVVIVNRPTSTSVNLAGLFGTEGVDDGIRQYNMNPQWQWGYKTFLVNGNTAYKDGATYTSYIGFTLNQWHVLIVDRAAYNDAACTMITGLGCYISTAYFKGDIGEVMVFNRSLTSTERKSLEAYLGAKWGVTMSGNPGSTAGTLSFTTDLTVYTNASVNLNGVTQHVNTVTCGGQITNGTLRITSGAVTVLKGGATLPGNAFSASQAMSVVMQSTDGLMLQGAADISNTTFSFADVGSLPLSAPFTLVSSTGTLTTGVLSNLITTPLPPTRTWIVSKVDNTVLVTLAPKGTMIMFQ